MNGKDSRLTAGHRLKIARGQMDKVISMVEKGEYCIDVIHQIQAVRAALKKTEEEVLDNHLKTCVVDQIKQGKTREVINEVMKVVERHG